MKDLFIKNKLLNIEEFNSGKIVLESKPSMLSVALTTKCNLSCIMCRFAKLDYEFTLPYKIVEHIFDLFPYLEWIDWQGGEVFLVDYFKEMLLKASSYPCLSQSIQTNGLMLDKEWSEILIKNNVRLGISIDGSNKNTYESIRKGGSFDVLVNNLCNLVELEKINNKNSKRLLSVCIMHSNYQEIEDFVYFAEKYKFKEICLTHMGKGSVEGEDVFYKEDLKAIDHLRNIMPTIERLCEEKKIFLRYDFKSFLKKEVKKGCGPAKNRESGKKCKMPWKYMNITALGKGLVYPECLCPKSIGNIMQDNILDIWNSREMQVYRLAILSNMMSTTCNPDCLRNIMPQFYYD